MFVSFIGMANLTGSLMSLDFQRELFRDADFPTADHGEWTLWVRGCSLQWTFHLGWGGSTLNKFMLLKQVMQIIVHVFRLFVFVYFSASIADFYSMSYLWISGLSVLTSFVVGAVMSLILGKFTTDD